MAEKLSSKTFGKYSSDSSLTVHNVFVSITEMKLKSSFKQSYGKVLHITRETQVNFLRNWRVILDIPEDPTSLPFTRNGHPKHMKLNLLDTSNGSSHTFTVTFHCRKCGKDGHPIACCEDKSKMNFPAKLSKLTKTSPTTLDGRKNPPKTSDASTSKISTNNAVSSRSDLIKGKKRVYGKDSKTESSRSAKINKPFSQSFNLKKECDEFSSEIDVKCNSFQDFKFAYFSTTPSTSNSNYFPSGSSEASYAASTSTSALNMGESSSSDAITSEVNTPGNSESNFLKNEVDCPLSLVERYVEETGGVLSRKELEAFLLHSKKKSNMQSLLSVYKIDAESLLKQVSDIIDLYYRNMDLGTKSDKKFIKILDGLKKKLERMDP